MANFNRVILLGNLTRDPKTSFTPNGKEVVDFGLAVNRQYRDKPGGELKEETLFIDAKAWEATARLISERLSKGSRALIEGRLKLDQWKANDGSTRSKHYVIVETVQFLDSTRAGNETPDSAPDEDTPVAPVEPASRRTTAPKVSEPDDDAFASRPGLPPSWNDDSDAGAAGSDDDDDIPF
ncbi:MAG: single-stranded DNA-binding protein [Planctomycetota bacterium]